MQYVRWNMNKSKFDIRVAKILANSEAHENVLDMKIGLSTFQFRINEFFQNFRIALNNTQNHEHVKQLLLTYFLKFCTATALYRDICWKDPTTLSIWGVFKPDTKFISHRLRTAGTDQMIAYPSNNLCHFIQSQKMYSQRSTPEMWNNNIVQYRSMMRTF